MDEAVRHGFAVPDDVRLGDLVDVSRLQALMDAMHRLAGTANAVVEPGGGAVVQSGWQELCARFHRRHAETCRHCAESDAVLAASSARGEPFASYRCQNGLVETSSPVFVGGRHVASLVSGQFFTEPPDMGLFKRRAAAFGFEEPAYLDAVAKVPVISGERVEAIAAVYGQLAQLLASHGMDRLHQRAAERGLEQANRGLAARTRELEAANKELEEFSYSMSHDMRTPLRAIDGFARILDEEHAGQLDKEGRRLLGVVRANAVRMACLIDDILRFLRIGRRSLACGEVDMAALARSAFEELRAGASQPVRLELRPLPPAWGDADMLRRVLLNLLGNAIKFTSPGEEAVIEVGGEGKEEENAYFVRDHGIGFDMKYADKLFKVFERLHPTGRYEGSAMGLALVKRIVGMHGGRVWAEGKVDVGAAFHFTLPHKGEFDGWERR